MQLKQQQHKNKNKKIKIKKLCAFKHVKTGSQQRRSERSRLFTFSGVTLSWPDDRDTARVAKEQIRHVRDNPQITMRDHYVFE